MEKVWKCFSWLYNSVPQNCSVKDGSTGQFFVIMLYHTFMFVIMYFRETKCVISTLIKIVSKW